MKPILAPLLATYVTHHYGDFGYFPELRPEYQKLMEIHQREQHGEPVSKENFDDQKGYFNLEETEQCDSLN